jgi:hypothetical protein
MTRVDAFIQKRQLDEGTISLASFHTEGHPKMRDLMEDEAASLGRVQLLF